jgi:hypothetical protein
MIKHMMGSYPIEIQQDYSGYASYSPEPRKSLFWNSSLNRLEMMTEGRFEEVPAMMTTVTLAEPALQAIEWAQRKMREEQEIEQLCQTTPALADLRDKFRATLCLVRNNDGQQQ